MKIYVATIPQEGITKRELLWRLRRRAKRWQFGIETGTGGYKHYQVRFECSNNDLALEQRIWRDTRGHFEQAGGWSDYELKTGDYYTSLDDELGKYRFARLQELQRFILSKGTRTGDRRIVIVVDKRGATGKTFLGRWAWLNGKGIYIDGNGSKNRIIASAYDVVSARRSTGCTDRCRFFIDLTRQGSKELPELLGHIEQLKNGYLKDERYSHREMWISPPDIIIFVNREPASWDGLSNDRWYKVFLKPRDRKMQSGETKHLIEAHWYDGHGGKGVAVFKS